jgi:hypothetical protein
LRGLMEVEIIISTARLGAEKVRQLSERLRLRSRLRLKEFDLRSTLTSTSACFLVPLRGRNGVPYDVVSRA